MSTCDTSNGPGSLKYFLICRKKFLTPALENERTLAGLMLGVGKGIASSNYSSDRNNSYKKFWASG